MEGPWADWRALLLAFPSLAGELSRAKDQRASCGQEMPISCHSHLGKDVECCRETQGVVPGARLLVGQGTQRSRCLILCSALGNEREGGEAESVS